MADCNLCEKREGKHKSTGGSMLCHECAHELGLGHSHPDHVYPLPVSHVLELEGVELKDHLAAYEEDS